MMRLRRFWLHSKANLWPIPVLIVGAESALALALVELDRRARQAGGDGAGHGLPAIAPDAAFNLLNLIAGSMMTVAATVFALTIVALTLASTQFTPRVMGNFMRSRVTQVALGVFLGIYAYCVLVMRQLRGGDAPFVPALAMTGAIVLAFVGIGFLIFFILYLFSSIQASVIAYRATSDSIALVDRLMPEPLGDEGDDDAARGPAAAGAASPHDVVSRRIGFIQSVDEEALFAIACRRTTLLRVRRGSGSFVVAGEALASLADAPDAATVRAVEAAFTIGAYRTVDQDIAYGIWELVDMALKALSAAVNDTSTGVLCVNYLTAVLAHAIRRRSPAALRLDADGRLRLSRVVPTFASLLDQAFDQIRHNANDNVAVIIRLLHGLETLARLTRDAGRRADLLRHARLVVDVAERSIRSPHERDEANACLARMRPLWGDDWPELRLSRQPPAATAG